MSVPIYLLIPYESHFFQPLIDSQLGPTIRYSRSPDLEFNNLVSLEYPDHTHFYTGGSKPTDLFLGLSVYSPELDFELKLKISEHVPNSQYKRGVSMYPRSITLGFRFGIVGSSKVEDCRDCKIATCIFSTAWLISRFHDLEDLEVGIVFCHFCLQNLSTPKKT